MTRIRERAPAAAPNPERNPIYEIAARVFHERGYDSTSMSDIARAVGLTKAGLYHHIASKEQLLYTIVDYGMDLTDHYVVDRVKNIQDPEEKLRQLIANHIRLIVQDRNREVTVILHENNTLRGAYRKKINARKKRYIYFVEDLIRAVLAKRKVKSVNPRIATFALLGMINWCYQWYTPEGKISVDELVRGLTQLFWTGLLGKPRRA